jgi:hypothetical protein
MNRKIRFRLDLKYQFLGRRIKFMDVGLLGDGNAQPITLNCNLPSRHGMAVGENPELVGFLGVERNDRAAAHPQELLHRHLAAPEDNGQLDVDVVDLASFRHATTPCDSALVEPERVAGA